MDELHPNQFDDLSEDLALSLRALTRSDFENLLCTFRTWHCSSEQQESTFAPMATAQTTSFSQLSYRPVALSSTQSMTSSEARAKARALNQLVSMLQAAETVQTGDKVSRKISNIQRNEDDADSFPSMSSTTPVPAAGAASDKSAFALDRTSRAEMYEPSTAEIQRQLSRLDIRGVSLTQHSEQVTSSRTLQKRATDLSSICPHGTRNADWDIAVHAPMSRVRFDETLKPKLREIATTLDELHTLPGESISDSNLFSRPLDTSACLSKPGVHVKFDDSVVTSKATSHEDKSGGEDNDDDAELLQYSRRSVSIDRARAKPQDNVKPVKVGTFRRLLSLLAAMDFGTRRQLSKNTAANRAHVDTQARIHTWNMAMEPAAQETEEDAEFVPEPTAMKFSSSKNKLESLEDLDAGSSAMMVPRGRVSLPKCESWQAAPQAAPQLDAARPSPRDELRASLLRSMLKECEKQKSGLDEDAWVVYDLSEDTTSNA